MKLPLQRLDSRGMERSAPASESGRDLRSGRLRRVRFADFEFDLTTLELFREGRPVPLPPKPSRVLALLLEHDGALVGRSELQSELWPDTVVEFDQGLNSCVRQLRTVLADDAEAPRFVETVPRRGYRFVAKIRSPSTAPPRLRARVGPWVAVLTLLAGLTWLSVRQRPGLLLAVLPLETIGGVEDDALFAEGLTEELIATLGRAEPARLRVLARSSSYRVRDLPLGDLRHRFDIDLVLQGRVRPEPGGYKVSLQIVRAETAVNEWALDYRQPLLVSSVASQEALAVRVSRAFEEHYRIGQLPPSPGAPASRHAVEWPIALRLIEEGDETSRLRAAEILEQVVEEAPGFSAARAALARVQVDLGAEVEAKRSIARAVDSFGLRPELALERGRLALRGWRLAEARPDLELAAASRPQSARAQRAWSYYLAVTGQHEQARRSVARAHALDPASGGVLGDAGLYAYWAGDPRAAIDQCRSAQRFVLDRYRLMVERCLLHSLAAAGDLDGALSRARVVIEASRVSSETVARALAGASPVERLRSYYNWAAEDDALVFSQGGDDPYRRALAFAAARQPEPALQALELAYAQRLARLIEIGVEPRLDSLRDEPRFQRLAQEVGVGGTGLARSLAR